MSVRKRGAWQVLTPLAHKGPAGSTGCIVSALGWWGAHCFSLALLEVAAQLPPNELALLFTEKG